MKKFGASELLKSTAFLVCTVLFNTNIFAQTTANKLDEFDRGNNPVLGIPAGSSLSWLETETTGSNNHRVRIENNMLVMSSANNAVPAVGSSGLEQASFDISNQYAAIFNQASSDLTWAFNFRQSRSGTSGFGATTYGIAYVLGSSKANFTDPDAVGYAIIIGNSNSPDPVKLIRFKNGLTANSNITTIVATAEITETAYYSVKVNFEPCTKTWSLQVRNDNGKFLDPLNTSTSAITFSDQTYTNIPLNFTGAAYNHGTASVTAYFDNIYVPNAPALNALNYTWTGTNSSDMNDPANWSPARNCVRAVDALHFNSGGSVLVSNITTQEIGKLVVANNTSVSLKAAAGAAQILSLAGDTGEDLVVETNSNLIIDSNDPLEISLKTGATASVNGNITFQNSNGNLGRAHRLLAADANAIIFEAGSQFLAKHLTGEPFGNSGTANIAIFKAGSTFISRDGAGPFGLASPNSKVIFETGSLYKQEQTGSTPKFDGRVYADFEVNVPNVLTIIYGTSAANPTRIDNFTISSGNMSITLSSGSTPLPLHIKGNLTVNPGSMLSINPAAASNTSVITFNGTSTQQISGNILLGTFANLDINNAAGVNLNSPLTINGNLNFTQGIVTMNQAASLNFADNATVSGASNLSYVAGKVYKTGNDSFTFPTGKNGFYAPLVISAPQNINDQYVAEYFQSNPKNVFGATVSDSLVHISDSEYWDLERTAGTSDVKVTLSYDPARSTYVANPQDLRIAHFKNNSTWANEGLASVTVTPSFSLFATKNPMGTFSPFTFGAISGNNPLPVELVNFSAEVHQNDIVLTWKTAAEINNSHFEIERSADGKLFEKIGEVAGQGNSATAKRYAFTDKNSSSQIVYYRLKQVDFDGKFMYSKIVSVNPGTVKPTINVYPNPAQNEIRISFSATQTNTNIRILNLMGQVVKTVIVKPGQTDMQLNISELAAGSYLLQTGQDQTFTKFIKVQ